jgi:hypothetical protein
LVANEQRYRLSKCSDCSIGEKVDLDDSQKDDYEDELEELFGTSEISSNSINGRCCTVASLLLA